MPQGKTLSEWIKIYEEKTKDKVEVPYGYRLFYLAERGFAIISPVVQEIGGNGLVFVYQTCGDAKFWRDFAEITFAAPLGLDAVCTACTRHIKPYIRSFGWEILEEQCVNGKHRFLCQDSIGRAVIITEWEQANEDTGEPIYYVSHYTNMKAPGSLDEAVALTRKQRDCTYRMLIETGALLDHKPKGSDDNA